MQYVVLTAADLVDALIIVFFLYPVGFDVLKGRRATPSIPTHSLFPYAVTTHLMVSLSRTAFVNG